MKITKYEHACLDLEEQGSNLVIDPGAFSVSFKDYQNIVAVVITHSHHDHFDSETVSKIVKANPGVTIYSVAEVTNQLKQSKAITVDKGSHETAGPFKLKFFGGQHAVIHSSIPVAQNVGVLVNDTFYYPGDSFSVPEITDQIKVLAVPASAPWMKTGEAMDFIQTVKPGLAFGTHNAFLSKAGIDLADSLLSMASETVGTKYQSLEAGQSTTV